MSDLSQHLELESLGILRQTKVPAELAWMSELEKSFILEMHLAGEAGVHKTAVAKLEKKLPDMVFNLTVRDLAQWLTDRAGHPVALALTWQGEDIANLLYLVAKHESHKPKVLPENG